MIVTRPTVGVAPSRSEVAHVRSAMPDQTTGFDKKLYDKPDSQSHGLDICGPILLMCIGSTYFWGAARVGKEHFGLKSATRTVAWLSLTSVAHGDLIVGRNRKQLWQERTRLV